MYLIHDRAPYLQFFGVKIVSKVRVEINKLPTDNPITRTLYVHFFKHVHALLINDFPEPSTEIVSNSTF